MLFILEMTLSTLLPAAFGADAFAAPLPAFPPRSFPPPPLIRAVWVALSPPLAVRSRPPLAVAPSPVPVIRPELSRVSRLVPRGA